MAGTRMLQRRGSAAEWAASNPILGDGEIGFERNTRLFKVGDGVTAWNSLAYVVDADLFTLAALDSTTAGAIASDGAGWIKKTYAQFKTALALVKADVGLGNVDNTSDVNKPVSTAQAAADATKQPLDTDLTAIAALDSTTAGAIASDGAGWIKKTYAQFKTALALVKADVGLGNVDNTSDVNKPVSTAQQTALDLKVAKAGDAMTGELKLRSAVALRLSPGAGDATTDPTLTPAAGKLQARKADATKADFDAARIDGTSVYDNGNRVYSSGNPPPGGGGSTINQTFRGTLQCVNGAAIATVTISTVVTAKSQLRWLGNTLNGGGADGRVELTNSTTITATRASTTGLGPIQGYELTEWT